MAGAEVAEVEFAESNFKRVMNERRFNIIDQGTVENFKRHLCRQLLFRYSYF